MFFGYRSMLAYIIMQALDELMIHEYLPFITCDYVLFKLRFENPVYLADGFFFQLRTAYQLIST